MTSISMLPQGMPSAGMSTSVVRTLQIVWPVSAGPDLCVRFSTWLTGDTQHYRPLVLQNWTTCTTSSRYLMALQTSAFTGAAAPSQVSWLNKSVAGGVAAGVYTYFPGNTGVMNWNVAAGDKPTGRTVSTVYDAGREGRGFTLVFNLQLLRDLCGRVLYDQFYINGYLDCPSALQLHKHDDFRRLRASLLCSSC